MRAMHPRLRPTNTPATAALLSLLLLVGTTGCPPPPGDGGVSEEAVRQNIFGTAYLGQQKWKEAEQAFRQALDLRPGDPLLLNNIAVALAQQSRIDEARELLDQALEGDPDYPFAHYNLGLIDKQAGEFEPAAVHFEAVAADDPDDLLTQYNLGIVLSRIGRDDAAEQAFRRALARDPSHVSSLYGLGRFLMQKGEQDEGARLIALSQEIRQRSGLDTAVGLQYGEQGPYALGVDYDGSTLLAPEPVDVTFRELARSDGPRRGCVRARLEPGERSALLIFGDDGVEAIEPRGVSRLLGPPPGVTAILDLAVGDVDNDGVPELIALVSADGRVRFALAERDSEGDLAWAGLARFGNWSARVEPAAQDLTLVDRDHDGDLDLFGCLAAAEGGGCVLGTNDGNGLFVVRDSAEHGFAAAPDRGPVHVGFSDLDNDRDTDLVVAAPGRIHVLSNQRDDSYEDVAGRIGLGDVPADLAGLAIADLDKDGWMDLVLGTATGLEWRGNRRGVFGAEPAPVPGSGGVVVLDLDNDGFLDLAHGGAGAARNRGAGRWAPMDGLLPESLAGATPLATLDADGDGDLDLAVQQPDGTVVLLSNEGGNARGWIEIENRGVSDNRFGIGAKVEVLAGTLRQKFEITDVLPLHVGLGDRARVESVRHLWPSGVLQDEIDLPAGDVTVITQLDRKGTSCPLLYAWRDGAWRFVTDFLGGSAIGYRHADGSHSVPDTDEYVLIEGGLDDDDGVLRLRVNNQLEEVIWFDQLELVVVDHPRGTRLYPNERLMPGPPWPAFELYASTDVRPVAAARGVEDGRDLSETLRELDRRFVDNFVLLPHKGYAEPHTLELDLGPLPADRRTVLLLDGWIDYADSTANLAAAQAGAKLIPPALTVADGRGGWRATGHRMGFPAGLPKTMAVDLSGLLVNADPRVRIHTTMRIHWDRARVMVGGERTELRVSRLRPLSAELRDGGFPEETSPDGREPRGYDPGRVASRATWMAHVGAYSAFGDVSEPLGAVDDDFVTTRNGDEIELTFGAPDPPGADWQRSYLLFADGFGKDMDPNSAANAEVGPIPFHGMPTYPYPEGVVGPQPVLKRASGARIVLPSEHGWPGAPPQPFVARGDLLGGGS